MGDRFIIVQGSCSAHCCFEYTVVDADAGKESYGDYWKKSMCECFDLEDAEIICNALNNTPGIKKYEEDENRTTNNNV